MSWTARSTLDRTTRNLDPMTTLEAQLESHLFTACRRVGAMALKLMPTVAGMPDRLLLFPGGGMFLVELKTVSGDLSAIQEHRHGLMRRLGISVHVLYGRQQIDDWVQWALNHTFEEHTARDEVMKRVRQRESTELAREQRGRREG